MIEKKDILKMVRQVTKRAAGKPDKRLIHPRREWFIGISMFMLIVLVGAGYSVQVHSSLDKLEENVIENDTRVIRYQEAEVQKALERYRAAEATFDDMRSGLQPSVQPVVETSEVDLTEETLESGEEEPDVDPADSEDAADVIVE